MEKKRKILTRLALMAGSAIFLAGCAAAKSNVQAIDARTLHVTTKATAIGNRSDVLKSMHMEIARVAAQRGYTYYVISGSKSYDDIRVVHSPGAVQYNYSYNPLLQRYEANRQQQESRTREEHRPIMEASVLLYKAGEIDPTQEGVWDVNSVLAQNPARQK